MTWWISKSNRENDKTSYEDGKNTLNTSNVTHFTPKKDHQYSVFRPLFGGFTTLTPQRERNTVNRKHFNHMNSKKRRKRLKAPWYSESTTLPRKAGD